MRWDDFRRSANVEDDRGASSGGFGMPGGRHGLGLGAIVVLGLIGWALGINPLVLINGAEILSGGGMPSQQADRGPPVDDAETAATKDFVAAVLGDTEDQWTAIFAAMGRTYHPVRLRLFDGMIQGGCGMAQAAMGPFYCPQDKNIYLDMSFFRDMQDKFGACSSSRACRFSEAYVVAHEVGHHVQDEMGLLHTVQAQQARSGQTDANALQVRVELQADCYAGAWANHAKQKHPDMLEAGDVDQALQTATAIGDDRLQKEMQGYVVPDSFTHGTSAQRKRWFLSGFNSGDISACNTMSATGL